MSRLSLLLPFLLFAIAFAFAGSSDGNARKPHQYRNLATHFAELPFTDAVLAGDTLYISGRIGLDPKTRKVPADIETEVHLLMDAVKASVTEAGMTMDDVVNITIYCPDLTLYDRFNAVYKTYFTAGRYPARAFIGSGPLLFGGHFEITAIAVRQAGGAVKTTQAKPAGKKK